MDLQKVGTADPKSVSECRAIALGCPAMGAEVLEEGEMEPFVRRLEKAGVKEKSMLLFGSYDWGDGQWMRDWKDRMEKAGVHLVGKGNIVHLKPDEEDRASLIAVGKTLAAS